MDNTEYTSAVEFRDELRERAYLTDPAENTVLKYAELAHLSIDKDRLAGVSDDWLSSEQLAALQQLQGQSFSYKWQVDEALANASAAWNLREDNTINKSHNKEIEQRLDLFTGLLKTSNYDVP